MPPPDRRPGEQGEGTATRLPRRFARLALALVAIAVALAAPARAGAADLVAPWVTSDGPRFVDSSGETVPLRGFDIVGPYSPSLWRRAADMGANFVRLPVTWAEIEPNRPVGGVHRWNNSLLRAVEDEIAYLESRNVNVLLDFHQVDWSEYFRPERSRGIPVWFYEGKGFPPTEDGLAEAKAAWWSDPVAFQQYRAFARMMVERFRGFPNLVGYELLNEPQPGKLRSTHSATQKIIEWQAALSDALRDLDPLRLHFVSSRQGGLLGLLNADFSSFGSLDKVALDVHLYFRGLAGTGYRADGEEWHPDWSQTHNQDHTDYHGTFEEQEKVFLYSFQIAQELGVPLIVGEWAAQNADSGQETYQRQVLKVYGKYGASWTRWDLSSNPKFGLLHDDRSLRPAAIQIRDELTRPEPTVTLPPVIESSPSIWGVARDGRRLIAIPSGLSGTPPFSFTYQWQLCDSTGLGCTDISGATQPTYRLADDLDGHTLRVWVAHGNDAGTVSAFSAPVGPVTDDPPEMLAFPDVSGPLVQGATLTADPGQWSGTQPVSFQYRWQRCSSGGSNCANILGAGATAETYTVAGADVGRTVRVKVTAANGAGSAQANSFPTSVISSSASPPRNTALPNVSGAAEEGQTLTASPGSWSGTAPISLAYQWLSCDPGGGACVDIGGAAAAAYGLTSVDVGSTLRVRVTATNGAGTATARSEPTGLVLLTGGVAPPLLAFVSNRAGNWDIWTTAAGRDVRLTSHARADVDPAWSPSHTKLAFSSNRDGDWDIYRRARRGIVRVTGNRKPDREPTWSPRGHKIVYAAKRRRNWNLNLISVRRGRVTRLTSGPEPDRQPAWSPDGSRIAFASKRDGVWGLYVLDLGTRIVSRVAQGTTAMAPAWSPDGTRLAYESPDAGDWNISVVDLATGVSDQITSDPSAERHPTWALDGASLAFQSDRAGNWDVYSVQLAGPRVETVTTAGPRTDGQPDW